MDSAYSILFYGEILAGHTPEIVRHQLQALLKCSDDTLDAVFSGQAVALRKGLPATEAERYKRHLTKLGLRVHVQPPLPVAAGPASDSAHHTPPAGMIETPAPPPGAEEMTCPQCGEKQPKRNLCRACAVDMPRLLAVQQANAEEARFQRERERQEAQPSTRSVRRSTPAADRNAGTTERSRDSRLFGLDFGGRMARGTFALASGLAFLVATLPLYLALKYSAFLLLGGLLLAMFAYATRLTVLRLHDLGRSGWWALLLAVPYLNVICNFVLMLAPSQKDTNAWGARPRSHGMLGIVIGLLANIGAAIAIGIAAVTLGDLPSVKSLITAGAEEDTAASAAFMARYNASRDRIEMFSLSTCGYCAEKRRLFDHMGVRYTEYIIDTDPAAEAHLEQRMRSAGVSNSNALGTPIIDVNGTFLPNNPDLDEIARHLSGRTRL